MRDSLAVFFGKVLGWLVGHMIGLDQLQDVVRFVSDNPIVIYVPATVGGLLVLWWLWRAIQRMRAFLERIR